MNIGITQISSKGQVVIPKEMREDLQEGEKLIIIKSNGHIIIKKASDADQAFQEDIEFAERTEKAYQDIQEGRGIKMDFDDFLEELDKW